MPKLGRKPTTKDDLEGGDFTQKVITDVTESVIKRKKANIELETNKETTLQERQHHQKNSENTFFCEKSKFPSFGQRSGKCD